MHSFVLYSLLIFQVQSCKGNLEPKGAQVGCNFIESLVEIKQVVSSAPSCATYWVPVCEDGNFQIDMWTFGGTDATVQDMCYDIKINKEVVSRVLYLNYLDLPICPRTEAVIKIKVQNSQTIVQNGKKQQIPITGRKFLLDLCFPNCGNATGTLKIAEIGMRKVDGAELTKTCRISTPNCIYYNGSKSSVCWGHGCQFYLKGEPRCVAGTILCEACNTKTSTCSHDNCNQLDCSHCSETPLIFKNRLSCRRANTYYLYHPKQYIYSAKSTGNCSASVVYAVNLNGHAIQDQNGVLYTAHKHSDQRDPHSAYSPRDECSKIVGVSHRNTVEIYASAMIVARSRTGFTGDICVGYPIPICQIGEYMLTIKMTEGWYDKPKSKCTEARLNNVPILIHADAIHLAGNKKCGGVDVVVMFLAEETKNGNSTSDKTLYLKGHDEPILVNGDVMELQFCRGDCAALDINSEASAFVLERLGDGTKECKL